MPLLWLDDCCSYMQCLLRRSPLHRKIQKANSFHVCVGVTLNIIHWIYLREIIGWDQTRKIFNFMEYLFVVKLSKRLKLKKGHPVFRQYFSVFSSLIANVPPPPLLFKHVENKMLVCCGVFLSKHSKTKIYAIIKSRSCSNMVHILNVSSS